MWPFNKNEKIEGDIGYYHLEDWWLNTFTPDERKYLEITFRPMGLGDTNTLTKGTFSWTDQTAAGFLNGLATWPKKEYEYLTEKIFSKAEELATNTLDKHFCYLHQIRYYYRKRSDPEMLQKAINACKKQITISKEAVKAFKKDWGKDSDLPSHTGYTQLAIICDKQGNYSEAIELCKDAKAEGWSGDWDKRIARYEKKQ